jgi:hypothetical protein
MSSIYLEREPHMIPKIRQCLQFTRPNNWRSSRPIAPTQHNNAEVFALVKYILIPAPRSFSPSPSKSATCPAISCNDPDARVISKITCCVVYRFKVLAFAAISNACVNNAFAPQNRDPSPKTFVIRQLPASIIVIIHRRQIIMNQRVSMNAFHRARIRQRILHLPTACSSRRNA